MRLGQAPPARALVGCVEAVDGCRGPAACRLWSMGSGLRGGLEQLGACGPRLIECEGRGPA